MMLMPWRMMQLSLDLMARGAEGARQLASPIEHPTALPPVAWPAPQSPPWLPVPPPTPALWQTAAPPPPRNYVEPVKVPAGVPINPDAKTVTTPMEDKKMSCCDQDLSGCDLKIVQYTIVSIDPFISDDKRVLEGPKAIAISDDLDEGDFKARVLGDYHHHHKECEHSKSEKRQYLRVCYHVECRFDSSCDDYEKSQAQSLERIGNILQEKLP